MTPVPNTDMARRGIESDYSFSLFDCGSSEMCDDTPSPCTAGGQEQDDGEDYSLSAASCARLVDHNRLEAKHRALHVGASGLQSLRDHQKTVGRDFPPGAPIDDGRWPYAHQRACFGGSAQYFDDIVDGGQHVAS